jgi:hypothetical protein
MRMNKSNVMENYKNNTTKKFAETLDGIKVDYVKTRDTTDDVYYIDYVIAMFNINESFVYYNKPDRDNDFNIIKKTY